MIKDGRVLKEVFYDLKLQLTWLNKVYLIVPRPIIKKTSKDPEFETQNHHQTHPRVCSIDPGNLNLCDLI